MRFLFLGDLYLNPIKKSKALQFSGEFSRLLETCNYVCPNLEGPVVEKGISADWNKKGPVIMQDKFRIDDLIDKVGQDKLIMNVANNHIMDYGENGLKSTFSFLEGKCTTLGAGMSPKEIFRPVIRGKVGLVGVAEGGFGVSSSISPRGYAWFMDPSLCNLIAELKASCEKVIIISHAGLEEANLPLPEIRQLYRKYIDWGADLVVAHHPHVIQGYEKYKTKEIYYSLGNFMFDSLNGQGEYNGESIGIVVDTEQNNMKTQVVPLKYENGVCDFNKSSQAQFENVTSLLMDERYDTLVNEICHKSYLNIYKYYYMDVCGIRTLPGFLLTLFRRLIGKGDIDKDMLYHNLIIESHYWTTCRGITIDRLNRV